MLLKVSSHVRKTFFHNTWSDIEVYSEIRLSTEQTNMKKVDSPAGPVMAEDLRLFAPSLWEITAAQLQYESRSILTVEVFGTALSRPYKGGILNLPSQCGSPVRSRLVFEFARFNCFSRGGNPAEPSPVLKFVCLNCLSRHGSPAGPVSNGIRSESVHALTLWEAAAAQLLVPEHLNCRDF